MAKDHELQPCVEDLLRLDNAGEEARKPFDKVGKEVEAFAYTDKAYEDLYQVSTEESEFAFKAQINRASEFLEVVGPYLYPQNPTGTITPRRWARYWQRARQEIESDYLTYAITEGDLAVHARRAIAQALMPGSGVLWTGYNLRKNVVQSVHQDVYEMVKDPDAKCEEEINWIRRGRKRQRWQLIEQYPEAEECLRTLPATHDSATATSSESVMRMSDLIETKEFYFRVGLANYCDGVKDKEKYGGPMKYVVAGGKMLAAMPWEIPFWRDGLWPCEFIEPRQRAGHIWGAAPMQPGLSHLKALNWIYTTYIGKVRNASHTTIALMDYNGQGVPDDEALKILKDKMFNIVRLKVNGDQIPLNQLIQQLQMDANVADLQMLAQLVGAEFEKATGLYEVLYSGQTSTQLRTAADVDLKRKQSSNRIDDMKRVVEDRMSRVLRKTLFAARFLEAPEDMGKLFGPEAAKVWGVLGPPEEAAREAEQRAQMGAQMQKEAAMAAQMQAETEALQAQTAQMQGLMPPPPMPPPPPLEGDELEKALGPEQVVSMDEWVNEAAREVEAGSMRRLDHDAQIENLNAFLQQIAPVVAPTPGGPALIAAAVQEFTIVNRYSKNLQDAAAQFRAATQAAQEMAMMAPAPVPGTGSAEKPPADESAPA